MNHQHTWSSTVMARRRANGDQTTPLTRRQVTFADTIVIHEGPCLQAYMYPDVEISKFWLTPQDNLRIKEDMKRTVQHMRRGCNESTHEGFCTRGLEHMCVTIVLQRLMQERNILVEAVINEQSIHGPHSSRIVAIASTLSKRARDRALHAARLDAASIR